MNDKDDERVFGGGRLWPTATVLTMLVAGWFTVGWLSDDRAFARSWWLPIVAAVFVGWLHWSATRQRVTVTAAAVSAGPAGRMQVPLAFTDVIGVHGGGSGSTSMLLANTVGVGKRVRRPGWLTGIAGASNDEVHMLCVPRLAATAANRAVYATVGAGLLAAGVPFTGPAALMVERQIRRAAPG